MNFGDDRLPARFWEKCIPEPNSGCWLWLGAISEGYGQLRWPDGSATAKRVTAHRVAVMVEGRLIPDDYTIDHRCEITCCTNPAHLDVVTNEENIARYWRRHPHTRCVNGHLLCEAGIYLDRQGSKHCRRCTLDQQRARRVLHPRQPKRFCSRGHARTAENVSATGQCRVCDRERKRLVREGA